MDWSHGGGIMQWLTRTDIVLLAIAAYVAVTTLVRLMQRRHDQLVSDVQQQVDARRKKPKRPHEGDQQNRDAA
jgi:hypothetical protein